MTREETQAMYAANCRTCLLAEAMKDCKVCTFNVLPIRMPRASRYILSAEWVRRHLNSIADLQFFPGVAEVRS